eukprot:jgi/Ulvmu1/9537/UM053_0026.1
MNFGPSQFAGGQFMDRHVDGGQDKFVETNLVESVRALTVSQLTKAQQQAETSQELMCDGRHITQVSIVGLLTGKFNADSHNVMTVYDGTGTIEVRQYTDADADDIQERSTMLVENTYVRVYGAFKGSNSEGPPNRLGYITAFSVRPVEDHNEVTHHQLDVIFQHMYLTQSQNMPGAGNVANGGAYGMAMAGGGMPTGAPMGGNILQPHGGGGQNAADIVHNWLKEHGNPANPVGYPISAIAQALAPQLREAEVIAAKDELEAVGRIFDTGNGYQAC